MKPRRLKERPDVYVMASGQGPVKIGVSARIHSRVTTLCGASPYPISVAYMAEVSDDPYLLETYVHWRLADKRLNAEWFDIGPEEAITAIRDAAATLKIDLSDLEIEPNLRDRGFKRQRPKNELLAALEARGVAFTPDGVRTNG